MKRIFPETTNTFLLLALVLPLLAACDGGGTAGTGVITAASDLEAGTPVCGTVTDETGTPIAEVTVQTVLVRDAVQTDDEGQFMLDISAGQTEADIVVLGTGAVVETQDCSTMKQQQ